MRVEVIDKSNKTHHYFSTRVSIAITESVDAFWLSFNGTTFPIKKDSCAVSTNTQSLSLSDKQLQIMITYH